MEPEGSLLCSQEPTRSPYPETEKSSQHPISWRSIWILSSYLCFIIFQFLLWWGDVSPPSNTQAGGPPLFGCSQLLIQYICSYLPYLEAFSSVHSLRTLCAVEPWKGNQRTKWQQCLMSTRNADLVLVWCIHERWWWQLLLVLPSEWPSSWRAAGGYHLWTRPTPPFWYRIWGHQNMKCSEMSK
jgi:hypothetical protein